MIIMNKFKNIFKVTLIINILGIVPLFLVLFMPSMRELMVYEQFPGMRSNTLANELFNTMMGVFGAIGIAMIVAIVYAIKLKTREGAITASFILFVWNIAWVVPDWINFLSDNGGHPPLILMTLALVPIVLLAYGLKSGEI